MKEHRSPHPSLAPYAWLSIAAALVTIALKTAAYFYTNSIGLLSDALESGINLAGAVMALAMLRIAIRPADDDHNFGHSKAEYFSSGVEGMLILLAAILIGVTAVERLVDPQPIERIGTGLIVSVVASLVNLAVSVVLAKAGRKFNSITLEADAKHLMTDVWTSAGVLIAVAAVGLTGWLIIDPIVAILVAVNIVWTGITIIRKSVSGLMDKALPLREQKIIRDVLESHRQPEVLFHAILTRQAGAKRFVSFHVLVPGTWTVLEGHHLLEQIESDLKKALSNITIITHLEPIEDPVSYNDSELIDYERFTK